MATGKEIRQFRSPSLDTFIADMMFNPKGDVFVAASKGKIVGWDPNSGKELFAWDGDPKYVKCLSAQVYDGRMFVSGGSKGAVNVWDLQSKQRAKSFSAGKKGLVSVAISSDGNWWQPPSSFSVRDEAVTGMVEFRFQQWETFSESILWIRTLQNG